MKRLVQAAQAGDRAALAELATSALPSVYRLVEGALGDRAEGNDVVQECMLRVIRGLPELRDPDRFRPSLTTIAIPAQAGTAYLVQRDAAPTTALPFAQVSGGAASGPKSYGGRTIGLAR